MFSLFKRKKVVASANPLQEKAAGWFVAKVLWLQGKWADHMDRRVNSLPVRWKKYGLMVFTGLSVLICVSIVIETFTTRLHQSFDIGKISKGKHVSTPGDVQVPTLIPERQYKRVVVFQKYMDSLNGSASGKRVYDSIVKHRPGLLDSAKLLEKIYHQQNK